MSPTLFEANEILKERIILNHSAKKALSRYREKGFYIDEPYLETEVSWIDQNGIFDSESFSNLNIKELKMELMALQLTIEQLGGYMCVPIWEKHNNCPTLVWAIFFGKENSQSF